MNYSRILIVLLIFSSCKGQTGGTDSKNKKEEIWEITNKTIKIHTYSKFGLLDTSFITEYFYNSGLEVDKKKSITIRKYDNNNNLILERTYSLSSNGQKKIVRELIFEFDKFNNAISMHVKSEGIDNGEKSIKEYNKQKQLIKDIQVFRKFNSYSEDIDIDTIAKHFEEDNKKLKFDTIVTTFTYNTDGACIKEISFNTKNEVQKTRTIVYVGKDKIASYDINTNNDTTSSFSYIKDGNLLMQILKVKEFGSSDTAWYDGKKEIKFISRSPIFKLKTEIKYNEHGDEIESITYK